MTTDDVVGTWELVGWESRTSDGNRTEPLGPHPSGRLVYTADGFVSVLVAGTDRPALASADPRAGTDADLAHAYRSFVAYSGRYHLEDGTVVHDVDLSLYPSWVGDVQQREVAFVGEELVLRTPPIVVDGVSVVSEIRWRRA